jgi:pimeloyl-ACP methyl ester carboxylesterase
MRSYARRSKPLASFSAGKRRERSLARPMRTDKHATMTIPVRELTIHGHTVCYRMAGSGPTLVLLHGITQSSSTWEELIPPLAEHFTVIAPDFLGHGQSSKPPGEYSVGSYASSVRDLLTVLGHLRATVVGHSLGGGVAMQFSYQFPEMCERLVLVSSGGLGRELHPILRLAALPGAEWVLPWLCSRRLRGVVDTGAKILGRAGLRTGTDLREIWRSYISLFDADARQAFISTVRTVIDVGGQRSSALDRLYLAAQIPILIIWGEKDPMIPVQHARDAHAAIHGSRLVVFPEAGHFPHLDAPLPFVSALNDFMRTSRPAQFDTRLLGEVVRRHGASLGATPALWHARAA